MKNNVYAFSLRCLLAMCLWTGCSESDDFIPVERDPNVMTFTVQHPTQQGMTRVTETAFEKEDKVGLFITEAAGVLEPSGNYVNNAPLTYSGTQWTTPKPVYWNQGTYDVYAYYPCATTVPSVDDFPFQVATDQSGTGYAQSDFLWASQKAVTASNGAVALQFKHRMSRLLIQLVPGKDYVGQLPANAEVYIHSTVADATVDLSAGFATPHPFATPKRIRAKSLGNDQYAAIIVPQRLEGRQPLVELIADGVSYLYEGKFVFKPGIQHSIKLEVSKNADQLKIEIGGEIQQWT